MSMFDWIIIIGIALATVAFLEALFFLVRYFRMRSVLKKLPKGKIRNIKKRKYIAKKRAISQKKKKNSIILFFVMLILAGMLGAGAMYASYYQSMNLTKDDSSAVVKGYYLLRDFEEQLNIAKNEADEKSKTQKNIRYLATTMASYTLLKASEANAEEGQLVLNRYYNSIKQLGMNASTQTNNFYGNQELVDEFLSDIKKAQDYESAAFEYYKVNEAGFSEDKQAE